MQQITNLTHRLMGHAEHQRPSVDDMRLFQEGATSRATIQSPEAEQSDVDRAGAHHEQNTGPGQDHPANSGVADPLAQRAFGVNRKHWRLHGWTASADTFRRNLKIGSDRARTLARILKDHDQAAVCNITDPERTDQRTPVPE
ncbi:MULTISPECIES: hypothetical protein [unclassified Saccharopolyspora]|uniref:hypothetical protein n=1 Tax=unclassified Saccharopolyspora TaxID=2646250 RepID=UPI001CD2E4F3|nr:MULTISPECIES: hypothetical protein [unclassified Saccharopolyspora]MCA1194613.1 hypothetical protein [Saccharopolyspora sp. 6V]MCA1224937.1 hypothetical protein [Saccharopolyspora sp. 6M]